MFRYPTQTISYYMVESEIIECSGNDLIPPLSSTFTSRYTFWFCMYCCNPAIWYFVINLFCALRGCKLRKGVWVTMDHFTDSQPAVMLITKMYHIRPHNCSPVVSWVRCIIYLICMYSSWDNLNTCTSSSQLTLFCPIEYSFLGNHFLRRSQR